MLHDPSNTRVILESPLNVIMSLENIGETVTFIKLRPFNNRKNEYEEFFMQETRGVAEIVMFTQSEPQITEVIKKNFTKLINL